ncbi:MAG: branched-chain amino acid ABC transporter permease [Rubrivivax sp.]
MDASHFLVSLLNGLSVGLLLFLLASGLTLIFSLMGVLNFAHASFYMLGAYVGATVAAGAGFWVALVVAPLVVGLAGAAFERWVLRRVHAQGHVAELLVTFGLAYVVVEAVQLVWGRQPLAFEPPLALAGPLFTLVQAPAGLALAWGAAPEACRGDAALVCTQFPALRAFAMVLALLLLAVLALALRTTRLGLVIRAALTHPQMAQALGHDVPRVFMLVFGAGTALAALAGVVGGAMRVTEPSMAQAVGPVVFALIVIGGLGSLAGAFVASLLLGVLDSFAVASDRSLADLAAAMHWTPSPETAALALWSVKLSQVAAILPYLLLVLVLVLRPRGLFGTREG